MPDRRKPLDGNGALAALLVAPRDFCFTYCEHCNRNLYYTYRGEPCPFCGAVVTWFVKGNLPNEESFQRLGRLQKPQRRRVAFTFDERSRGAVAQ